MTDLRQAAQQALEALESGLAFDAHSTVLQNLREALEQPEQEPSAWRDMVVVSLVREGVNKHRARELADHFAAQPEQEPVAWEHHEYRPYGAPGEIRIHAILASQYMMPDGSVSSSFQWLVDEYKKDKNTIKLIPLYTTPPAAQWDKPAASFNDWWDSYHIDPANPFVEGTAAYWAWSGWKAAQRPWVGLTPEEILDLFDRNNVYGSKWVEFARTVEAKLKAKNDH
jgi:hypothetical protein